MAEDIEMTVKWYNVENGKIYMGGYRSQRNQARIRRTRKCVVLGRFHMSAV